MATHVPAGGAGGGMIRYVVELARGLAADPRVDLHLLAAAGTAPFWRGLLADGGQAAGGRVHEVAVGNVAARSLLERRGLASPALRRPFDVVHGAKHLLPARCASPTLLTVLDMLPLDRPGDFGAAKRRLLRGPYLASLREADVVVAISAAALDRADSYVPGVAARAAVVPLATSSTLLEGPAQEVPALAGAPFALVVGDASARKNRPLVVDAWPRVAAAVPGARLAVAGPKGWGRDVQGGSAHPDVHLLGHVSDAALRWCYGHAAVVACPSLLEGYGLPAAEALALGARVVTSEDPALCEASGAAAAHVSTLDPDGWVDALVAGLRAGRPPGPPPPVRTWTAVAAETVDAVLAGRAPAARTGRAGR